MMPFNESFIKTPQNAISICEARHRWYDSMDGNNGPNFDPVATVILPDEPITKALLNGLARIRDRQVEESDDPARPQPELVKELQSLDKEIREEFITINTRIPAYFFDIDSDNCSKIF